MEVKTAEFIISNTDYKLCPDPHFPEYAFIGRSNVGKSSLINMLTNHKKLAKTSQTPGKTQLINHFHINEEWYLVDLPGYGYAKVSKSKRGQFQGIIHSYLLNRENLMCTFVLLDSRHEPQKADLEFMQWMGEKGLPFVMVFTKIDKQSSAKTQKNIMNYKKKMLNTWEFLPEIFMTSAVNNHGKEEILNFVNKINESY